jgi:hypothetical protein
MTHVQINREFAARLVRAAVRRFLLHAPDYSCLHGWRCRTWPTAFVLWPKTINTVFFKASFPTRDGGLRRAESHHNLLVRHSISERQNQRAEHITRWQRSRMRSLRKFLALVLSQSQQVSIACHNIQAPRQSIGYRTTETAY